MLRFDPALDWTLPLAVLAIPLAGFVVNVFVGRSLPRKGDWLLTGGMFVVMAITCGWPPRRSRPGSRTRSSSTSPARTAIACSWLYQTRRAPIRRSNVTGGLLYDNLGAALLAVVGRRLVLRAPVLDRVHEGGPRYHIFFANISLFTFAMLGLVLSDNILFFFVFWELMGLMYYLLIGHFAHDPTSPRITQRPRRLQEGLPDDARRRHGLFIGMMMFFLALPRRFQFTELWRLAQEEVARNGGQYPTWMTVAGCSSSAGRSASRPSSRCTSGCPTRWKVRPRLGDDPRGDDGGGGRVPAGRTYPLLSPEVLAVVTVVGPFTALFAATIGTTVNDIKGVLAYSTILAARVHGRGLRSRRGRVRDVPHGDARLLQGVPVPVRGFRDPRLPPRAGHAPDGRARKADAVTFACMLASTLAIAGIPLFSGFYSKDRIIMSAFQRTLSHFDGREHLRRARAAGGGAADRVLHVPPDLHDVLGQVPRSRRARPPARGMHGHDAHGHDDHGHGPATTRRTATRTSAHESPWPMTVRARLPRGCSGSSAGTSGSRRRRSAGARTPSLVPAAVEPRALYGGLVAEPPRLRARSSTRPHVLALYVSLASRCRHRRRVRLYYAKKIDPARIARRLGEVYHAVANKYWIDEIVERDRDPRVTIASRSRRSGSTRSVVDGHRERGRHVTRKLGFGSAWFDLHVVDGAVNGVGATTQASARRAPVQTGRIQQYVSFAVAGRLLLAAAG
jgi:NADH-quinone oxidoreductase subunit L